MKRETSIFDATLQSILKQATKFLLDSSVVELTVGFLLRRFTNFQFARALTEDLYTCLIMLGAATETAKASLTAK